MLPPRAEVGVRGLSFKAIAHHGSNPLIRICSCVGTVSLFTTQGLRYVSLCPLRPKPPTSLGFGRAAAGRRVAFAGANALALACNPYSDPPQPSPQPPAASPQHSLAQVTPDAYGRRLGSF